MNKQRYRNSHVFVLALILFILTVKDAYAYIDPSAGSMILQIILGGVTGIAILVKLFWRKIKDLFGHSPNEPTN